MHDPRTPKIEIISDQIEADYSGEIAADDYDAPIDPPQIQVSAPDLGWDD
jgi:hypothetical protein